MAKYGYSKFHIGPSLAIKQEKSFMLLAIALEPSSITGIRTSDCFIYGIGHEKSRIGRVILS